MYFRTRCLAAGRRTAVRSQNRLNCIDVKKLGRKSTLAHRVCSPDSNQGSFTVGHGRAQIAERTCWFHTHRPGGNAIAHSSPVGEHNRVPHSGLVAINDLGGNFGFAGWGNNFLTISRIA